eukprot:s78_g12.t1
MHPSLRTALTSDLTNYSILRDMFCTFCPDLGFPLQVRPIGPVGQQQLGLPGGEDSWEVQRWHGKIGSQYMHDARTIEKSGMSASNSFIWSIDYKEEFNDASWQSFADMPRSMSQASVMSDMSFVVGPSPSGDMMKDSAPSLEEMMEFPHT